jgi:hypothetical protein
MEMKQESFYASENLTFAQAVKRLTLWHPGTSQRVTPDELIKILKDDVIQCVTRSGSWEASNMLGVLRGHGLIE